MLERKGKERKGIETDKREREKSLIYKKLQLLVNILFLSRSSKEINNNYYHFCLFILALPKEQSESLQIVQNVDF